MKIAQISMINGAITEGNVMRVSGLSQGLHDLGHSVLVVCKLNSKRLVGGFEKADAPLLKSLVWLYGPRSPVETVASRSPYARLAAYRLLSPLPYANMRVTDTCSVLHCHLLGVASLMLRKRRQGQKVLLDFHGMLMLTDTSGTPIADTRGTPVDSLDDESRLRALKWQSQVFEEVDGVSFVTAALRDKITPLYDIDPGKTYVIPDGVNFRRISRDWQNSDILRLRQSWGKPSDVVVMYVGALDSLHGASYLEKVIRELLGNSRVSTSVRVVLIGGGVLSHLFADLQRGFGDRFVRIRRVSYEMLPTYLASADILLVPHARNMLMENIESGKLLNYLASGKPTVVTSLASVSDFLEDNVSCIMCHPDHPSTMVSGIERLVDSPELRQAIGKRGAEVVERGRDWSFVAQGALQVYHDLTRP
ncbi:MAG: glycosyltransferase [Candidatus Thermoplasmatota archaeon]